MGWRPPRRLGLGQGGVAVVLAGVLVGLRLAERGVGGWRGQGHGPGDQRQDGEGGKGGAPGGHPPIR